MRQRRPPARRAARRTDREPTGERAGPGDGDLLAEHRPHRELVAVDVTGRAAAGRRSDERADQRIGAELFGDRHRVGVEIEQPPAALHGDADVTPVRDAELAPHVAGGRRERGDGRAAGEVQHTAIRRTVPRLDAGHRPRAEELEHRRRSNGSRYGRRNVIAPGAPAAGRARFARNSRGELQNTSRTVSLNWRTLANPGRERNLR